MKKANKLLAGNLPPGQRMKIAKLRLFDQTGILLRQRRPDAFAKTQ